MGLLTGSINQRTRFAESDYRATNPRFTPDALEANVALVALLQEWARRKDATPAQIALAWLLAQKPWIVPIPGTTQLHHLDENLGAIDLAFTTGELVELNTASARIEIKGARLRPELIDLSDREAPFKNQ